MRLKSGTPAGLVSAVEGLVLLFFLGAAVVAYVVASTTGSPWLALAIAILACAALATGNGFEVSFSADAATYNSLGAALVGGPEHLSKITAPLAN